MIFDLLNNHHHYPLGSAWLEAFSFLQETAPNLEPGKHFLRGEDLFAIVMDYHTQPPASGELEAHRRYLDIQVLLSGQEGVACHFVPGLEILQPYDPASDAELFRVPPTAPSRLVLSPGCFLAFFPQDAHMPCLSLGPLPAPVRKVVVKLSMDLLVGPGTLP